MRRFIYLDTDTLNSYLAQIFDGLIQSQEMEKSAGKKKEKQNHFGSNLGSQIAFKLFGKGIDANAQATYEGIPRENAPGYILSTCGRHLSDRIY